MGNILPMPPNAAINGRGQMDNSIAARRELTQQSIDKSEIATLRAQRNELLAALREIAAGDGIYGLQAREYQHIARAAIAKAEGRS